MEIFEDLKLQWQDQPKQNIPNNGARLILEKVAFLKRKQQITNMVLIISMIILIGFFIYVGAYMQTTAAMAFVLMIVPLFIRVSIEHKSVKKLKQINISESTSMFKAKVITYHKNRIRTHYIITPILILSYCFGFTMLLPFFKQGLSYDFYIYILVSGVVVLLSLAFFIRKQILNELIILKELKN
ncbi:hypothetical protein MHTCC0001_27880 [Flavobacteriaceae bacterium MHTCC 0001]